MKNNNTNGKGRNRPTLSVSVSNPSHLQVFVELPSFCLHHSTRAEATVSVEINDLGSSLICRWALPIFGITLSAFEAAIPVDHDLTTVMFEASLFLWIAIQVG
ncbi:hypothetical protein BofuT4_P053720.1 [Botrytis cinerea T4]|uniref:Uncharacterized protein n=1 Tax=Botryotinia fuckeliana (strain T4) TaxID=999810 RepID=G2XVF1_BOTF4|nr:hypothetical protein BofuT4_P053720.1 [Botrytis cinerea T4]